MSNRRKHMVDTWDGLSGEEKDFVSNYFPLFLESVNKARLGLDDLGPIDTAWNSLTYAQKVYITNYYPKVRQCCPS